MLAHAERTSRFYAQMLASLSASSQDVRTWTGPAPLRKNPVAAAPGRQVPA